MNGPELTAFGTTFVLLFLLLLSVVVGLFGALLIVDGGHRAANRSEFVQGGTLVVIGLALIALSLTSIPACMALMPFQYIMPF